MKISRFFLTKDYASAVDRQFCHSSRRIDCQFGEFCLKPFANCVVIEKIQRVCLPPQEDAIFVGTVVPHARGRSPEFCDRVTVIRPNPFIGYQSQRGRWISRDTPLLYIISFFSYNVRYCKKMKGLLKETTESAPNLSLARPHIVRHKSGISLSSRV